MHRLRTYILLFLSLVGVAATQDSDHKAEHAKRVWESAIAAKGGHTRLQSVRTLGIQTEMDSTEFGRSYHGYSRAVYEFPSRFWMRAMDPPYRRGLPQSLILDAVDGETGLGWINTLDPSDPTSISERPKPTDPKLVAKWAREKICEATELFLLESRWYKPEVLDVDETKWLKKDVLTIFVRTCSGPGVYVVDPKTKLILAFIHLTQGGFEERRLPSYHGYGEWRFDDYSPVDGILMPRKTTFGETGYEINREYPRSLFTKRPEPSDWGPWPPPAQQ